MDTEAVTLRLPRDTLNALEDLRREQENIPTRPEAIRQILTQWLRDNGYLKD